jgi:hypothetical protein
VPERVKTPRSRRLGVDLEGCSGQTRSVVLWTLLAFHLVAIGPGSFDSQFEWGADGVCPGAAAGLSFALSHYLGEAPAPAHIEATLSFRDQGPAGVWLDLRIASDFGQEQHELAASDCDRLIDQAALLLAGVIDPFASLAPDTAPSSAALHHAKREHGDVVVQRPTRVAISEPAAGEPEATPSSNDVVPSASGPSGPSGPSEASFGEFGPLVVDESRPRAPILGAIGVGATGVWGVFPQIGGGVELEGALERGPLRWQNTASGWFGGRFRSSEAEVGADLLALGFATSLCGVPAVKRVRVPLCAVAGVGAMRARAVGTIDPRSSTQPWVWAGAEVSLQVLARQDLAIALGIGAHGILVRPGWEIRAPDVSYRVPPVMGLLRLTLEVRELGRKKSTSAAIGSR